MPSHENMHPVEGFELILAMLLAVLALHWLAVRLRWPPSIAFLLGGGALAFLPGFPAIQIDPELVLVLFLPPLLMDGAWNTALARFRRHLVGILSLAIGAVVFTTVFVAAATHWLIPSLPWAACAALGAIVAPPDAVSARSVLQRVELPRRISTLLEGESLLNDAAGIVIFRFAVAVAVGGQFDLGAAMGRFFVVAVGGVLVGLAIGRLWIAIGRRLRDNQLLVITSVMVSWIAYVCGDAIGVSGVIATVTAGLVLGWQQHVIFSAETRVRGVSLWETLIFLFEAMVFMLIGFSLRGVLERAGGLEHVIATMLLPLSAVIVVLIVSRFLWLHLVDLILGLLTRMGIGKDAPLGHRARFVMGWAGMRGVVTLAVALSLPEAMPGRDFMLVCAFAVILVTVIAQGATLGFVIQRTGLRRTDDDAPPMGLHEAELAVARAQLIAVENLAKDSGGAVLHPQLLERYTRRTTVRETFDGTAEDRTAAIAAHFDIIIAAARAGRDELVRLHRAHRIDDDTLHDLERDLDLEELGAIYQKG
jgi:monovalent cation/hydrogen antiporter